MIVVTLPTSVGLYTSVLLYTAKKGALHIVVDEKPQQQNTIQIHKLVVGLGVAGCARPVYPMDALVRAVLAALRILSCARCAFMAVRAGWDNYFAGGGWAMLGVQGPCTQWTRWVELCSPRCARRAVLAAPFCKGGAALMLCDPTGFMLSN